MSHDCSESTTTSCMRSEIDGAGMASTAQAKELVALGGDSCTGTGTQAPRNTDAKEKRGFDAHLCPRPPSYRVSRSKTTCGEQRLQSPRKRVSDGEAAGKHQAAPKARNWTLLVHLLLSIWSSSQFLPN